MVDKKALGEALKARRIAKGMTLRDLATKVGLTHAAIDHIENGRRNTTVDTLSKIAEALDTSIDVVVADIGGPPLSGREAVLRRFSAILPNIPDDELDVFVHELALWERRYGSST
jgi:transcriptional regulator with XRE-family HTH domain